MGMMTLFRRKQANTALAVSAPAAMTMHGGSRGVLEQYAVRTLVDRGVMIEGSIMTQNGAAIDGNVKGQVCVVGKNAALLIRESAHIAGDVYAPIVVVSGRVTGKIEARFVRLYKGCHVKGTIRAARLIVDDGAIIENDAMDAGVVAVLPPPVQEASVLETAQPAPAAPVSAPPDAPQKTRPSVDDFLAAMGGRPSVAPSWVSPPPSESEAA